MQTDRPMGNGFGRSVATNGTVSIVGAPKDGDDFLDRKGAAYLFSEDEHGNWIQVAKVQPPDDAKVAYFGDSVDISGDVVIVGAPTGRTAFLYRESEDGIWNEVTRFVSAALPTTTFHFADSVAIDHNTAIVGGSFDGISLAHIYRDDGLGNWLQIATLSDTAAPPGPFGESTVDISGDTAIVGFYKYGQRTVYIFREDESGAWNQDFKFAFSGGFAEDFDKLVSIDGDVAVASGSTDRRAFVFGLRPDGHWGLVATLSPNTSEYDDFGCATAISSDKILVGATLADEIAVDSGTAYVFHLVPEPRTSTSALAALIAIGFLRRNTPMRT
jgi:hypothetical protein